MKLIRFTVGAALLMGVCLVASCNDATSQIVEREGEPDVVFADHGNGEMAAATEKARKSLPHFWEQESAAGGQTSDFMLKVGLPTNDDSLEHIWVDSLEQGEGNKISGVLANEPYNLKSGAVYGDAVSFTTSNVTDWTYTDGERMRGHFTTRVLIKTMEPQGSAEVAAMLHEEPLP